MESGILYNAIFENEKTIHYNRDLLAGFNNILSELVDDADDAKDIVFAYDTSDAEIMLCNDMRNERIVCYNKI